MKVLWFTNVPLPEMKRFLGQGPRGAGGHWMSELLRHLAGREALQLGVATACPGSEEAALEVDGVAYFVVPQPRRLNAFAVRHRDLDKCAQIVEEFRPDLIHVHGSERFYGLLKVSGRTNVPMIVSLQGLLNPYSTFRNFFGALSVTDIVRSVRFLELPLRIGLLWQFFYTRKGARREAEILSAADVFLGRTSWDHAHVKNFNDLARYFHVGEIMRPPFYVRRWRTDACEPHTLFYTNAGHPRRGTEDVLLAVSLLKHEFPNIKLRLAGILTRRSGYARFLRNRVRTLSLQDNVESLGYLDADAICRELLRANVFVLSSYIENSPNSLGEAMLVGMPCIASSVGGIPDMIEDGKSGLLFPAGDVPLLVSRIRQVFNDKEHAVRLGVAASIRAHARHNPEAVTNQLLSAYKETFRMVDSQ